MKKITLTTALLTLTCLAIFCQGEQKSIALDSTSEKTILKYLVNTEKFDLNEISLKSSAFIPGVKLNSTQFHYKDEEADDNGNAILFWKYNEDTIVKPIWAYKIPLDYETLLLNTFDMNDDKKIDIKLCGEVLGNTKCKYLISNYDTNSFEYSDNSFKPIEFSLYEGYYRMGDYDYNGKYDFFVFDHNRHICGEYGCIICNTEMDEDLVKNSSIIPFDTAYGVYAKTIFEQFSIYEIQNNKLVEVSNKYCDQIDSRIDFLENHTVDDIYYVPNPEYSKDNYDTEEPNEYFETEKESLIQYLLSKMKNCKN